MSTKVNENLLDNSVFLPGCLVNQRGQTSYTVGNTGPDRWRVWGGSITITDSGITPDATGSILQFFERPIDSLLGRMVCATILWSDGTLTTGSSVAPSVFSGATVEVSVAGICNFGFSRRENVESPYLFVNLSLIGKIAEAIKLELGDTQTLAHQDSSGKWVLNELPNYADTLVRCQRYLFVSGSIYINCESQVPYLAVPYFLPKMRAIPSCTVYSAPSSEQLGVAKRTTNYLSGQQIDSTGDVWVNTASIGSSGGTLLASEKGFDPNQYVFKIVANAEL